MATSRTFEIDERFQGIPGIALGGYVGGLLAQGVASAEVTLRRPVMTGRLLRMDDAEDGTSALLDGDEVLASVRPVPVALDVPAPVSWEDSVAASSRSLQRSLEFWHPFPRCLVCGAERAEQLQIGSATLYRKLKSYGLIGGKRAVRKGTPRS